MKIGDNTKVFVAVLVIVFAVLVIFDLEADDDEVKIFVTRLFTSAMTAGAATFFWNQSSRKKN